MVGTLSAPIEIDDPRTGARRVRDDGSADPMMVAVVTMGVSGVREFELAGDLTELSIDGVQVWSAAG